MARVTITNLYGVTFVLPHPLFGELPPHGVRVFDDLSLRMLEESESLRLALASNQFTMQVEESSTTRNDIEQASVADCGSGGNDHDLLMHLDHDTHLQYLPRGGARAMTGNLDLGTHNVTNVGTVDGVDVSAHAARHQPGGLDPLISIDDAQHGNRGGGTLHAVAVAGVSNGFLASADKTKLDGLPVSAPPSSRQIISGGGLTGGGDLSSDRTLAVGANIDGSITVNVDDIQVGVLASDIQHGVRGGSTLHAVATPSVAGFLSAADKTSLDALTTVYPETVFTRTISYTAVGGERVFKIPLGNYFKGAAGETTLFVNGNELFLGPDYSHVHRNFNNGGPTSTIDTCIGFRLSGGTALPGWTVVFTWKERQLLITPPSVATVHVVLSGSTWVPDYSIPWQPQSALNAHNAIQVPLPPPGYVVEFWRLTHKKGGFRWGPYGPLNRDGQRFLPYVRGPAVNTENEGLFRQVDFDVATVNTSWKKFRVCYYRPATGARSALSSETILSAKPGGPYDFDSHNGRVQVRWYLWVNR